MKRIALLTAVILLTVTLIATVWQLHGVVLIFLLSLAIAATLGHPIEALAGRGWRRGLAIGTVYVLIFGPILLLLVAAGYFMARELDPLVQDLVRMYGNVQNALLGLANPRTAWVERLPTTDQIARLWAGEEATVVLANVATFLTHTGRLVTEFALSIFLSLYWTADRNRFERLWFSLLPAEQRIRTRMVWRKLETDVGAYLRSEILQTVLAVLIFAVGYSLLGIKYPFTLAVLAGVLWLAPLLGGILAVVPVVLIGLMTGPITAAAATAFTIVVLLLLEFYLQRRLYTEGRYWGVLLILIMLATVDEFGFVGLLLAAPIALAVQIAINEYLNTATSVAATVPVVVTGDLPALQKRLDDVRQRVQSKVEVGEQPSPRLLNLIERLETLIADVQTLENAGVPIPKKTDEHETVVAGKLPMDLAQNNI
jgi:predicted PurR-regulated permease PerM